MARAEQSAGSGAYDLWYPPSFRVQPSLPTRGLLERGYPVGAVIYFTGGTYGLAQLDLARRFGQAYLLVDEFGGVHQGFPLDRAGRHVDEAADRELLAIELEGAGYLTRDTHGRARTAWGTVVPDERTRAVPGRGAFRSERLYHAFTVAQEAALFDLLLWLKTNNPTVFDLQRVVGHSEISPVENAGPGGALSMAMGDLRRHLAERYRKAVADGGVRTA